MNGAPHTYGALKRLELKRMLTAKLGIPFDRTLRNSRIRRRDAVNTAM